MSEAVAGDAHYWATPHSCEHTPDLNLDFSNSNGAYFSSDSKLLGLIAEREGLNSATDIKLEPRGSAWTTIIEWNLGQFDEKAQLRLSVLSHSRENL
jgi:hypothetical protein